MLPLLKCAGITPQDILIVKPVSLPNDISRYYPSPLLRYQSLLSYVKENKTLTENEVHHIFKQLLHLCINLERTCNIFPLHPKNIIINPRTLNIRIIIVSNKKQKTHFYTSPEQFEHYRNTSNNSLTWNLGSILFFMFYRQKPFRSLHMLLNSPVVLKNNNNISLHSQLFIEWCLKKNPKHRISLRQCKYHPWVTQHMP